MGGKNKDIDFLFLLMNVVLSQFHPVFPIRKNETFKYHKKQSMCVKRFIQQKNTLK